MAEQTYDLIVLGSGPGGYVAAIRAAQLGMKTAIVERDKLGGICLNWGCIPTKALLRASEINHLLHNADEFGFTVEKISYDAKKLVARSRDVADKLSKGVAYLMKKHKIDVIEGTRAPRRAGQARGHGQGQEDLARSPPSTSCSPPARARAPCRGSSPTAR